MSNCMYEFDVSLGKARGVCFSFIFKEGREGLIKCNVFR